MSPTLVALIFSIGGSGWFYKKMAYRSGEGNLTPVIIGSVVTFTVLFIASYLLFNAILK